MDCNRGGRSKSGSCGSQLAADKLFHLAGDRLKSYTNIHRDIPACKSIKARFQDAKPLACSLKPLPVLDSVFKIS